METRAERGSGAAVEWMQSWVGMELDDALAWARQRSTQLLAVLDDAELLALLGPDSVAAGPGASSMAVQPEVTGAEERPSPSRSACTDHGRRDDAATASTDCGAPVDHGLAERPPSIQDDDGRETDTAKPQPETAVDVEHLRAHRDRLNACSDWEVLGVANDATEPTKKAAYERLAARWHPAVAHGGHSPEAGRLLTEIFVRIEQAYRATRRVGPVAEAPPQRVRLPRPGASPGRATTTRTVVSPVPRPQPSPEPVPPPTTDRRFARHQQRGARLAQSLRRGPAEFAPTRRVAGGSSDPASPSRGVLRVTDGSDAIVARALALVEARRWHDAIAPLRQAIAARPTHKLRALFGVVQARQAAVERDFPRAREHYESVLALDPDHVVAQRELLMISAVSG